MLKKKMFWCAEDSGQWYADKKNCLEEACDGEIIYQVEVIQKFKAKDTNVELIPVK